MGGEIDTKLCIFATMAGLTLKDFHFDLPERLIPKFPLENRDSARLLLYQKGRIQHKQFIELPELIPGYALLVFNESKVIPARLVFRRQTGARIEILLLEPKVSRSLHEEMASRGPVIWESIIGGLKKWKEGEELKMPLGRAHLSARLIDREKCHVELSWSSNETFSEILERAGRIPLPPYLKRETVASDKQRYQTIFAKNEGAVAAPTAGLHFTEQVMETLVQKGIKSTRLTLHVGAGTFLPVKEGDPRDHAMHNEKLVVLKQTIIDLIENINRIIPVGTTSLRTIESLYWWGCKLIEQGETPFFVGKLEPYELKPHSKEAALKAVLRYFETHQLLILNGETEILIYPGYRFALCYGLITNFHMPESTLIMLVSAFIGKDWRWVYQEAIDKEYRFLSYGDSSLLLP